MSRPPMSRGFSVPRRRRVPRDAERPLLLRPRVERRLPLLFPRVGMNRTPYDAGQFRLSMLDDPTEANGGHPEWSSHPQTEFDHELSAHRNLQRNRLKQLAQQGVRSIAPGSS